MQLSSLLIAPAERADVIVDFGDVPVGAELYLINEGPDEPFGGGVPQTDFAAADPATTAQVMKFVVVPGTARDRSRSSWSCRRRGGLAARAGSVVSR